MSLQHAVKSSVRGRDEKEDASPAAGLGSSTRSSSNRSSQSPSTPIVESSSSALPDPSNAQPMGTASGSGSGRTRPVSKVSSRPAPPAKSHVDLRSPKGGDIEASKPPRKLEVTVPSANVATLEPVVGGTPMKTPESEGDCALNSPPPEVRTWSPQTPPLEDVPLEIIAIREPLITPSTSETSSRSTSAGSDVYGEDNTTSRGGGVNASETTENNSGRSLSAGTGTGTTAAEISSPPDAAKALTFSEEDKRPTSSTSTSSSSSSKVGSEGSGGAAKQGTARKSSKPESGKEATAAAAAMDAGKKDTKPRLRDEEDLPVEELEQLKKHIILLRPPGGASPTARGPAVPLSTPSMTMRHLDPMATSPKSKVARESTGAATAFSERKGSASRSADSDSATLRRAGSEKSSSFRSTSTSAVAVAAVGKDAKTPWEVPTLFHLIVTFSDFRTLCQLLRVSKAFHAVGTSDVIWKPLTTETLNLQPLAAAMHMTHGYYRFFIDDIITTRALQGHYTYASVAAQQQGGAYGGGGGRAVSPVTNTAAGDILSFDAVTLLISSATFGQMNHPIGRVQLLIRYKNETMEVLQGSCRFSPYRRCYSFCTNAFSCPVRGPVFTVTVAQVHKPWPGESPQHFASHKGGVRLVMTPALLEGKSVGSQVSEVDVIAVSKAAGAVLAASASISPMLRKSS